MEKTRARNRAEENIRPKTKIEVGHIFNTGVGYIRLRDKEGESKERVFLSVRELVDLKDDLELVLNHYYLRNAGYRITKK